MSLVAKVETLASMASEIRQGKGSDCDCQRLQASLATVTSSFSRQHASHVIFDRYRSQDIATARLCDANAHDDWADYRRSVFVARGDASFRRFGRANDRGEKSEDRAQE